MERFLQWQFMFKAKTQTFGNSASAVSATLKVASYKSQYKIMNIERLTRYLQSKIERILKKINSTVNLKREKFSLSL